MAPTARHQHSGDMATAPRSSRSSRAPGGGAASVALLARGSLASHPPARLLVTIGPSGSGKSSVVGRLAASGLLRVHPTWTTRPRRTDELGGALEHRFVSNAEFDDAVDRDTFVGTVAPFGMPYRYGLPRLVVQPRGPIDAVMLRARLVDRVRDLYGDLVVYAIVADPETTSARLLARGLGAEELRRREDDNLNECAEAATIAHRVFDASGCGLASLASAITAALEVDFMGRS